jgi:hypothetical protein
MPRTSRRPTDSAPAAREVASPDGTIAFSLKRTALGVHVERREFSGGSRVTQSSLFKTREDFERFCDIDPLRFEHPHTYQLVKRAFHDLFQLDS